MIIDVEDLLRTMARVTKFGAFKRVEFLPDGTMRVVYEGRVVTFDRDGKITSIV